MDKLTLLDGSMPMNDADTLAAPHVSGFIERLGKSFQSFGHPPGLPSRLRQAVEATPRHRFVHRFREGPEGPLSDFDADPEALLQVIYRGQPLTHVDAAGAALPSTNSEAAYVLWLVHRLGIEPGDRVLEIGSGSGWLLAVMAHLAGPDGQATGVEIIPSLADQSRTDLAALDRRATVIEADATAEPDLPLANRMIVTAATWDVPLRFFDLVEAGGRLLIPLRSRRAEACDVALLRRNDQGFKAESVVPGWFVLLVGAGQSAMAVPQQLEALPSWQEIGASPSHSHPLWLGETQGSPAGSAAIPFRRYLALTEPEFAIVARQGGARGASDFGLVSAEGQSVTLYRDGQLLGFGTSHTAERLAGAYARWAALGMPGSSAYTLEIMPAHAAPAQNETTFVDRRGESAFVRRLDPKAGSWRVLTNQSSS